MSHLVSYLTYLSFPLFVCGMPGNRVTFGLRAIAHTSSHKPTVGEHGDPLMPAMFRHLHPRPQLPKSLSCTGHHLLWQHARLRLKAAKNEDVEFCWHLLAGLFALALDSRLWAGVTRPRR